MGGDLDKRNGKKKVYSDALVKECLVRVRKSLEQGLWVKSPRFPEELEFREQVFPLKAPICCFTEWSLGDSLPHTVEYGRMGFGFPKRWVIERGGQSVTYFRHNEKGHFLRSAFKLLEAFAVQNANGDWTPKPGVSGFDELNYLLHFAKMIRLKRAKRKKSVKVPIGALTLLPRKKPAPASVDAQTFKRKFGLPLEFVEEREWRIVHQPGNKHFVKGPKSGLPDYYLPYIPGEQLFTLVLPDHKVIGKLLQNSWFTERLFTPWRHYPELNGRPVPAVTLLAHSDIGTF